MKKVVVLAASLLAGIVLLSGCLGGTDYKDCGGDKTCVEDAIYNDCKPAKAELSGKTVTVRGERVYGSSEMGAMAKLCEVNFKYSSGKETTCAYPVYERKELEWYEWAEEYCTEGGKPPKTFK